MMWKISQLRQLYTSFKTSTNRMYQNAFKKHLLLTNVVTFVSLYGVGDCIIQAFEQAHNEEFHYDYKRTGRMVMFATVIGPPQHFWYVAIDRFIVKGSINKIVAKKVLSDQILFAPVFYLLFFGGLFYFICNYWHNNNND